MLYITYICIYEYCSTSSREEYQYFQKLLRITIVLSTKVICPNCCRVILKNEKKDKHEAPDIPFRRDNTGLINIYIYIYIYHSKVEIVKIKYA